MKKELTRREKVLFFGTILLLLGWILYEGIWSSIIQEWKNVSQEISIQEKKLEKSLRIISRQDEIERKYKKYANATVNSEETEIAVVLKEVEQIANKTNVKTTNIKAQPVKDMKFYKKVTVGVECEANIKDLVQFIYNLQKSPQILRVQKLRMGTKGKNEAFLKVSFLIDKILIFR